MFHLDFTVEFYLEPSNCVMFDQWPPQLIIVIMSRKSTQTYGEIKKIILGLPTQCIIAEKVTKSVKAVWANIGLKINAKLGGNNLSLQQGELWWIEIAQPKVIPVSFFTERDTFIGSQLFFYFIDDFV